MGTTKGVPDVSGGKIQGMKLVLPSGIRSKRLVASKKQGNNHRAVGSSILGKGVLKCI
jgi:hypothetical protein